MFEITMYWQRTNYMWVLQAGTIAALALMLTEGKIFSQNDGGFSNVVRALAACIWLFGLVAAYFWLLIVKGAKFWQDNWQFHVDMLEDLHSGALYKTYPKLGLHSYQQPFSVTRVNEVMVWATIIFWLLSGGIVVAFTFCWQAGLALVAVLAGLMLLQYLFDPCLRSKLSNERLDVRRRTLS